MPDIFLSVKDTHVNKCATYSYTPLKKQQQNPDKQTPTTRTKTPKNQKSIKTPKIVHLTIYFLCSLHFFSFSIINKES